MAVAAELLVTCQPTVIDWPQRDTGRTDGNAVGAQINVVGTDGQRQIRSIQLLREYRAPDRGERADGARE